MTEAASYTYYEVPKDALQVPCPHCGYLENHAGTCQLSLQRSGDHWMVAAIKGKRS